VRRRLRYVPCVPDRDEPRLLHRRLGYTARVDQALPMEPEAVSEDEQTRMTRQVREAERARTAAAWKTANAQITSAVNGFQEQTGELSTGVRSGVRAVLRASEQVGRKLQA
jgi:hypothetical protein